MSQSDFVSRGQALVAAGQFQEAVKVCRLGLLGRPTTVEGRVVLGQALLALKRYDEVLAEMRVALELDHGSVTAQVLRAEALLRKNDYAGAAEALHQARQIAPGDARVMQLLGEIERDAGRPTGSASHPAVGYVGSDTRHYPSREMEQPSGDEDSGGSFTRPTSLAAPNAMKRTPSPRPAAVPGPGRGPSMSGPTADELAVGDRSGTVEVDPELEAEELGADDDLGALAGPPVARAKGGARLPAPSPSRRGQAPSKPSTPAIEIDDDDLLELAETRGPPVEVRSRPGASAVRDAVRMPSGPIDMPPPRANAPSAPPPLARALAAAPHMLDVRAQAAPTPQPLPPPPAAYPPAPGVAAAGNYPPRAMPLGGPAPMMPPAPSPAQVANAARPTVAIVPSQPVPMPYAQQLPAPLEGPYPSAVPPWAGLAGTPDPRAVGAAFEPTARPAPIDPAIAALMSGTPAESGAVVAIGQRVATPVPATGARQTGSSSRKPRSRLQLAMWVLVGIVVIGGGVFAGFQIRAMRLEKDIAEARVRATQLAQADTWAGWIAARDRLADIEQASDTLANRAALARARAVIAFEFGDGLADAKTAVDALGGSGGLDGKIAAAYLALAEGDPKAAKLAADAALSAGPDDPAASYVAGRVALLEGDIRTAENRLRAADQREPRPLYGVGLARALAAATTWDDAEKAIDRIHAAHQDNPAAAIARGQLLAESGRLGDAGLAAKVHAELAEVVAAGGAHAGATAKASPAQVALADLALARVDFARGELTPAKTDVAAAAAVPGAGGDQGFAEEATATLFAIGDLTAAASAADDTLARYPHSLRARLTRAEIAIAQGKPRDALDLLSRQAEATATAPGLAVRGEAKLGAGDPAGARADFDAALKLVPTLEPALVGAAWIDLADGNLQQARARIEPRYQAGAATPAILTVYAAILRASGDAASRDKAKELLDKVIAGPAGAATPRAQLELARLDRDTGDYPAARTAFQQAIHAGDAQAALEYGELLIDDSDPRGGRDVLDQLLQQSGDHPSAALVLATARARMLAGDNRGADELLKTTAKLPDAPAWQVAREQGRLALRRGDYAGAATALSHALDGCGKDVDTYLLAADVVTSDVANAGALATKVKTLAAKQLGDSAEEQIVEGKLRIATEDYKGAESLFEHAKDTLDKRKAPNRLIAQARFGSAVAKYEQGADADARNELTAVRDLDPSLYAADLFMADLLATKGDKKQALAIAQHAVSFDPELVLGWGIVGEDAAALGDKKTLADAIGKLGELAPNDPELKKLEALRR